MQQHYWPSFRGNIWNNPQVTTSKSPEPSTAKTCRLGGIIWGTAVIDNDNNVYVGSTNKRFYCIDNAGRIKWVYKLSKKADSLIDSAASLHPNGFVVIPGGDGCLHAIHMQTGKPIWIKDNLDDVSSKMHESGVVVNSFEGNVQIDPSTGLIYAGCDNDFMYCINPQDGSTKWKFKTKMMIWTCAAIIGNVCFFGSLDFKFYGVHKLTGELLFEYNTGSEVKASPLFHKERLFVGNTNGKVICFLNGKVSWTRDIGSSIYASPVILNDTTIAFVTLTGEVYALNTETGDVVWSNPIYSNVCCSPLVVNNVLYVCNSLGKIIAFNAGTGDITGIATLISGQVTKRRNINASLTLDRNGYLVVGGYNGLLYYIPHNFYKVYNNTSFQTLCEINPDKTQYLQVYNQGHIITIQLIVPHVPNAAISHNSIHIHPEIPFEKYISADGKFINLIPKDWSYLNKEFTVAISGSYYLQTNHWVKDRFVFKTQKFNDIVTFKTATSVPNQNPPPSKMEIANMYVQQPLVLDTYIPAAMDAQGFIAHFNHQTQKALMIPCIPDEEDEFTPLDKGEPIEMTFDVHDNIIKVKGAFNISAMGGTIKSKKFVAFIETNGTKAQGQFFSESSCFAIKGNGSNYKFSSEIINQLCDARMTLHVIGEFTGTLKRS